VFLLEKGSLTSSKTEIKAKLKLKLKKPLKKNNCSNKKKFCRGYGADFLVFFKK